jgi:hypothetical protein
MTVQNRPLLTVAPLQECYADSEQSLSEVVANELVTKESQLEGWRNEGHSMVVLATADSWLDMTVDSLQQLQRFCC